MKFLFHLLLAFATFGSPSDAKRLPKCGAGNEIQFFNAYVDVMNLPPDCNLIDVGFLVQDVVEEVDAMMPSFDKERMLTKVCPYPDKEEGDIHRFQSTGRAERCPRNMAPNRQLLETNDACLIADRVNMLQGKVKHAAVTSNKILKRMKEMPNSEVLDTDDLDIILDEASEGAQICKEMNAVVEEAGTAVTMMCAEYENRLRLDTETSVSQAETELTKVEDAAARARKALSQTRKARHAMNVLYHMESSQSRRQLKETCSYADDADIDRKRCAAGLEEALSILQAIELIVDSTGTKEANALLSDAKTEYRKCEGESRNGIRSASQAEDACNMAQSKGQSTHQSNKARVKAEHAQKAADQIEKSLSTMRGYLSKLEKENPRSAGGDPTAAPTTSPTASPAKQPTAPDNTNGESHPTPKVTTELERSFLARLQSNIESSNTSCQGVANAVLQRTLAEESLLVSHDVFDELVEISVGKQARDDVSSIRVNAFLAYMQVQDESAKAAAAATRASTLCDEGHQDLVQKELEASIVAVNQTRVALGDLKIQRDAMEEVVALIGFDPTLSQLVPDDEAGEIKLLQHMGAVDTEISHIDSQIQALSPSAPEIAALETKRASLEAEEMTIEESMISGTLFPISQSALKKDELYESVAPDFEESPPQEYTSTSENISTAPEDTSGSSRDEWFQRFSDLVAFHLSSRLSEGFSESNGGCIVEGTDVIVQVVITEIATVWEQFIPTQCSTAFLARGKGRGPSWK